MSYQKSKGSDESFADSYRTVWAIPASIYIAFVALVATIDRVFPFEFPEIFSWLQIL